MKSPTDKIIIEREGAIARLILNSPARRNAIGTEMWQAIPVILRDLDADDGVRVIVVKGAGGKAFSAGADISEFKDTRANPGAAAESDRMQRYAHDTLAEVSKPTIAMIEGYCIGGGVEVAILCDIQIAADTARFGVTPAKLGLGYRFEDVRLLLTSVGPKYTKEILFTGRQFSAAEALAMGLINRVVPESELAQYVDDYARTIAENAPLSVRAAKRTVEEAIKDPADRDLEVCERLVDACYASDDYNEGRTAFAEKRKPRFTGR
ncbi:MAG: enoyl-CoA hydratase [Rhodospirillales bacterium]|nr:enoyl-CoA hydratase [Rhodospirillales bacterium]